LLKVKFSSPPAAPDILDGNWSFELVVDHVFKKLGKILVLGKLSAHGPFITQLGAGVIKRARMMQDFSEERTQFKILVPFCYKVLNKLQYKHS